MSNQPLGDQSGKSATELARDRTSMAVERTAIAEERTLMAWIRTSVSLIGFGFSIYKFFQYLRMSEHVTGVRPYSPRNLGLTLIGLGTAALIVAAIQHRYTLRRLGVTGARYEWSLSFIVALLVALVGIVAFASILLHVGPF